MRKIETFREWLEKQVGRDDVVGDFAGDVARDTIFPTHANKLGQVTSYLREYRGITDTEVLSAARLAWAEYILQEGTPGMNTSDKKRIFRRVNLTLFELEKMIDLVRVRKSHFFKIGDEEMTEEFQKLEEKLRANMVSERP